MFAEFFSLPLDIRVNIMLCILSFLLAVISIAIVIISIRQNNKLLEANSRPYISAFLSNQNQNIVLTIKNFGNSSAYITDFVSSADFSKLSPSSQITPFKNFKGSMLAPGQAVSCGFKYRTFADAYDSFTLTISYTSDFSNKHKIRKKNYVNKIDINVKAFRELFYIGSDPKSGKELKHIAKTLHSIDMKLVDK